MPNGVKNKLRMIESMIKIICICSARPNFMKIALLMQAFKGKGNFHALLVNASQHYDIRKVDVLSFISNHL
jgi:UDP-N-acetylglucosamine 2-epimerase